MFKLIRLGLYGLATTAGVAGLFAGGVPLAKFAWKYWRDHQYGYYYDANSLYFPEIVFLLSLSLLVFVHLGLVVGKGNREAGSKPELTRKPAQNPPASLAGNLPAAGPAGPSAQAGRESADEKLARLLHQKKD